MSGHPGDMAAQVADQLREKHIGEIERGERELESGKREMESEARSLFDKIEYRWRASDQLILEQIRSAANAMFAQEFAGVIGVLDGIYEQVRVPQVNEYGLVVLDQQGRIVWQRDQRGQVIEDWNRLTGQDLQAALFNLQRLSFSLSMQLNELLSEALFSKHIYEEIHHEAYAEVVEGTVKDREARASREARVEKYHAHFRFVLWSAADAFMKELNGFKRLLERTLSWNVWHNDGAGRG